MDNIYNRIESLCNEKSINITTMCRESNVSRSTLTELKSGRTKTLLSETASKISDYFGVSTDYLLGKTEKKEKPTVQKDDELSKLLQEPDVAQFYEALKKLTTDELKEMLKYGEYIKSRRDK